jgi:hypothetical protein
MQENIQDAINLFSQKLKRFKKSGQTERIKTPGENAYLQEQIRERAERLRAGVVQTYRIYKAPFEALGKNSDRAAGIDRDEQALLEAYNLYSQVMEINGEGEEEQDKKPEKTTYISRLELKSPLTEKAGYVSGGQFIYLLMWLYFEQNCQKYMPLFAEKDGNCNLIFVKAANYSFESHDKEIFEIVRQEFYS